MNARRSASALALAAALLSAPLSAAGAEDAVRWYFGVDHGQWSARPSAGLAYDPRVDLEEQLRGGAVVVRVDLDGDGANERWVATACGNGGCEYPIFRGRDGELLGAVFGSAVWILERRVREMPLIRTYARVQASRGAVSEYAFDGRAYRLVGTTEIGPEEYEQLFSVLAKAPKP